MARPDGEPVAESEAPVAPPAPMLEPIMTLAHYCESYAHTVSRPIMAGFRHVEREAGHASDTASAYSARMAQFLVTPL